MRWATWWTIYWFGSSLLSLVTSRGDNTQHHLAVTAHNTAFYCGQLSSCSGSGSHEHWRRHDTGSWVSAAAALFRHNGDLVTDARNWLFSFTTLGRGEMGSLVTVKLQISGEKTHCGVSQCPKFMYISKSSMFPTFE